MPPLLVPRREVTGLGRGLYAPPLSPAAFPLKRSGTNRYLVDQKGTPFLFCGDSPWWLATRLSLNDALQFLNDRQARGFNSLLIELIDNTGGANSNGSNINGDMPFTTVQGGGTYNNGATQSPDFSTPNEPYWKQVDTILTAVAARNFQIFLYVIWLGALQTDPSTEGYYNALNAQSSTIRQNYGVFVGNRYKWIPNLIWVVGGDDNPTNTAVVTDVFSGIQSVDTTHLFTTDLKDGDSPLTDTQAWTPASNIVLNGVNNIYTNQRNAHPYIQANAKTEWQRSDFPNVPYFLKETQYEDGSTTAQYIRAEVWASLLGGCCGYHFGNTPLWNFGAGWQATLGMRGTLDTLVCFQLIQSHKWWLLVPDWGNLVLTNGASYTNATFVPCAQSSDGSWGALYTPANQSLTVAMGGFSAPVNATWIDPTNGAKSSAGNFTNSGSHTFSSTPGNNAQGDADWALLFET